MNNTITIGYGNRKCECCGETFLLKRPNQKYCSKDCRLKFHREKASQNRKTKEIVTEVRECLNCGNTFVWSSTNKKKNSALKNALRSIGLINTKNQSGKRKENVNAVAKHLYGDQVYLGRNIALTNAATLRTRKEKD